MVKFPITPKGFEKLDQEIKRLKHVDRHDVIKEISVAREFGDLSENAEYHAAREKQSFIEGRIIDLESKLSRAEVIDINQFKGEDRIKFGATVVLLDYDNNETVTYVIVGEYEADIAKGMISIISPIAKALIGKSVGDVIEVVTPKGSKNYEIEQVLYKEIEL